MTDKVIIKRPRFTGWKPLNRLSLQVCVSVFLSLDASCIAASRLWGSCRSGILLNCHLWSVNSFSTISIVSQSISILRYAVLSIVLHNLILVILVCLKLGEPVASLDFQELLFASCIVVDAWILSIDFWASIIILTLFRGDLNNSFGLAGQLSVLLFLQKRRLYCVHQGALALGILLFTNRVKLFRSQSASLICGGIICSELLLAHAFIKCCHLALQKYLTSLHWLVVYVRQVGIVLRLHPEHIEHRQFLVSNVAYSASFLITHSIQWAAPF